MATYDHSGHRARLKKRFIREGGFENFEDHNILEMLLFYTIPRRDTNELAHKILDKFGSLYALFDAPYEELIKTPGISENTACLIKAILPAARAYNYSKYQQVTVLNNMNKVSDYLLGKYAGFSEEVLGLVSMDNCYRALSFDILAKGTIDSVIIDVRKIIETLINNQATMAIIVHNHPSGFAIPSPQDVYQTRKIIAACNSINVSVLDHNLIAHGECISMHSSKEYIKLFDIPTNLPKEIRDTYYANFHH